MGYNACAGRAVPGNLLRSAKPVDRFIRDITKGTLMHRLLLIALPVAFLIGCTKSAQNHSTESSPMRESNPTTAPVAPVEVAMPAKLEAEGWTLVPRGTFSATQVNGVVTIGATGEAPSGGYEVKLVQSMLKIWPPQHLLYWKKPQGMATQAFAPFDVKASFRSDDPVSVVIVTDGSGSHEVKVEQSTR